MAQEHQYEVRDSRLSQDRVRNIIRLGFASVLGLTFVLGILGLYQLDKIKTNIKHLKRIKHTTSQTYLTKEDRNNNIREAFKVRNKKKVLNKNILIVDDVFTTGSTLLECARVLDKAGAANIYLCTIALA